MTPGEGFEPSTRLRGMNPIEEAVRKILPQLNWDGMPLPQLQAKGVDSPNRSLWIRIDRSVCPHCGALAIKATWAKFRMDEL